MTDPANSDAALDARECFMLIRSIARNEGFGNIEGAATKGLAALAAAAERADELQQGLNRCRADYHAKVIALQKKLGEAGAALLVAQQEREEAYERGYERGAEEVTNKLEGRAERAEAALLAAQQERDEWHAEQQKTLSEWQKEYLARKRAEATNTRLRLALERIEQLYPRKEPAFEIARAALAQDAEQA